MSRSFVLLSLSFCTWGVFAFAGSDMPLGVASQVEVDRVSEILVRCGGWMSNGKSELAQRLLEKNYSDDFFDQLSYRERVLSLLYTQLVVTSDGPISRQAANVVMDGVRAALPVLTEQYFGRKMSATPATLKAIAALPGALQTLGLLDPSFGDPVNQCVQSFSTPGPFLAPEDQRWPLSKKAAFFEARTHSVMDPDHLVGASADGVLWTGIYLASQGQRYQVTHEEQAQENIESILWTFHHLHKVTGHPTLLARQMMKHSNSDHHLPPPTEWHYGHSEYENYIWRGRATWDMYVGYLYGIAESWSSVQDAKLKEVIRQDLREMALRFVEDGLKIDAVDTYLSSEPDSCFSDEKCGLLEKIIKNIVHHYAVSAGNALRALHLLSVAAYVTEDPAVMQAYQNLLDQSYWTYARDYGQGQSEGVLDGWLLWLGNMVTKITKGIPVQATLDCLRNGADENLAHITHYSLIRLEKNEEIRNAFTEGFIIQTHKPVQHEGNSFWNFLYAKSSPGDSDNVREAIESLRRFPLDSYGGRRNSSRDNIPKYKGISGEFFKTGGWQWYAVEPLPVDMRPMPSFAWQGNAYQLDGEFKSAEASGVAFLAAYWLGRMNHFIAAEE